MKKLAFVLIIVVIGFLVVQYWQGNEKKKRILESYYENMEMPVMKIEAFFSNADEILALKDSEKIRKETKKELSAGIEAVEADISMISVANQEAQSLHTKLLKQVGEVRDGIRKAQKSKASKIKNEVGKQVSALSNYYAEYEKQMEALHIKYNTIYANKPKPTQEPNKYEEYDEYLESAKK